MPRKSTLLPPTTSHGEAARKEGASQVGIRKNPGGAYVGTVHMYVGHSYCSAYTYVPTVWSNRSNRGGYPEISISLLSLFVNFYICTLYSHLTPHYGTGYGRGIL